MTMLFSCARFIYFFRFSRVVFGNRQWKIAEKENCIPIRANFNRSRLRLFHPSNLMIIEKRKRPVGVETKVSRKWSKMVEVWHGLYNCITEKMAWFSSVLSSNELEK